MDTVALIGALLGMQTAATQQAVAAQALKTQISAEKSVLQLLQPPASTRAPAATPPGVGSNLDISA